MTMQDLRQLFNAEIPETYDVAPPQGAARYLVLNPLPPAELHADNTVLFSSPRCRADLGWTSPSDAILETAAQVLRQHDIAYSMELSDYDFDNAMFGASLTISLLG